MNKPFEYFLTSIFSDIFVSNLETLCLLTLFLIFLTTLNSLFNQLLNPLLKTVIVRDSDCYERTNR